MTVKIALVTGGNRGIGLEICRQLAEQGVTVLMGSRDLAKGEKAVSRLREQGLSNVHPYQLTVNDEGSIQQLYADIEGDFDRLDILINNAGVFPDTANSLLAMDLDILRKAMDVNAYAPVRLTQVMLPLMKKNGWGRIVNMSTGMSDLDEIANGYPAYRFSKLSLNVFTRMLARDLMGTGIKVNAMDPGWVRTDMGGASAPRSVEQGADTAVWLALLPDDGPHGGYFFDRQLVEW